ncbi:MAG: TrmH family RNA methyltransferase [Proteobacteria bacterium]|nr:TrmH family RNA methyltransferase [Pseudomonadota bacterium]
MRVAPLGYPSEEVRRELARLRHPLRIAVDRFKNPFNVGAIIRTAHSFLAQEILLLGEAPYYKRASMGMEKYEHIVHVASPARFVQLASEKDWRIIAFERDHARVGLWQAELPARDAVLVFGNEDTGVDPSILDAAEQVVAIPMFGVNHSYPVSVAAGIAMAEWTRRYYPRGRGILGWQ